MNRSELNNKFGARRIATITVQGEAIRVRSLTGLERGAWDASKLDEKGDFSTEKAELNRERFIALCIVDENDRQMYLDAGAVAEIAQWGDAAIVEAFDQCWKHNLNRLEPQAKN